MKDKKYWALLVGILMGMIIGVLSFPEEVWAAEPVLIVANGQAIIEDQNHPSTAEVDEAVSYLSENGVKVPDEIEVLCKQYGREYGIAPELLEAIAWKESRFKADAVNASHSCHGLMQINRGSHRARMAKLGVSDLYEPKNNIRIGADYLAELFEQYEDLPTVLELYNGDGSAAADTSRDSSYAQKVMRISEALEKVHW